jgi:hypothetical protein
MTIMIVSTRLYGPKKEWKEEGLPERTTIHHTVLFSGAVCPS